MKFGDQALAAMVNGADRMSTVHHGHQSLAPIPDNFLH